MKNVLLANGRRIAYSSAGRSRNAVPLVLLHGFCEDSSLWDPVLPGLRGARILRIDLPGFGASDLPLAPGMGAYADAVCAVLNDLGIGRCVLAGHSMGGYAALEFARHYPERLAGLGLVHSHPYADTPERIENRRRGIDMLQAGKKDLYVAQLFPGLFAPDFAEAHPEVVQAIIRRGRRQAAAGIIAGLKGMIERTDHLDTLQKATCPVLFLLGEQDAIIPPEGVLSAAAQTRLADIHVLPAVGHLGMLEAADEVGGILLRFWQFCVEMLKQ